MTKTQKEVNPFVPFNHLKSILFLYKMNCVGSHSNYHLFLIEYRKIEHPKIFRKEIEMTNRLSCSENRLSSTIVPTSVDTVRSDASLLVAVTSLDSKTGGNH